MQSAAPAEAAGVILGAGDPRHAADWRLVVMHRLCRGDRAFRPPPARATGSQFLARPERCLRADAQRLVETAGARPPAGANEQRLELPISQILDRVIGASWSRNRPNRSTPSASIVRPVSSASRFSKGPRRATRSDGYQQSSSERRCNVPGRPSTRRCGRATDRVRDRDARGGSRSRYGAGRGPAPRRVLVDHDNSKSPRVWPASASACPSGRAFGAADHGAEQRKRRVFSFFRLTSSA